jgi:hypothetical protein
MIDKAVDFLEAIQRFVKATETTFIDTVSVVIPWLAPAAPAWIAWRSMTVELAFPIWLAAAMAAVIELLGLATINTVFQFWSWNQDARKSEPRSPVALALVLVMYYFCVILTVNTMLDGSTLQHKIAKGLLSSISVVGGVTIALRAAHARRVRESQEERARIRAERKGVKFAKSTSLQSADEERSKRKAESMEATMAYVVDHPEAGVSEIAKAIGKSRPSVYGYIKELESSGRIKTNGHLEVIHGNQNDETN